MMKKPVQEWPKDDPVADSLLALPSTSLFVQQASYPFVLSARSMS